MNGLLNIKEHLRKIYNNNASSRSTSSKQLWKIKSRKKFLELLITNNIKTLLEVGAGTGQDSLFFKENGIEVTAIDLSDEHIKHCIERGIHGIVMDFYHLEFPKNSFDSIYSLNSLLHVPKNDLSLVLKEIHRVLKPNGIFFLGVYGGREFEGINEKDNYEDKRFFSFYHFEDYKWGLSQYFEIISSDKEVIKDDVEFHHFILRK